MSNFDGVMDDVMMKRPELNGAWKAAAEATAHATMEATRRAVGAIWESLDAAARRDTTVTTNAATEIVAGMT